MTRQSERAVHFVGIGGIGMSALARILLARGERVTGSSDRPSATTRRLEDEGARIAIGHTAANVAEASRVVVSSAIADHNPERTEARARGLEVLRRGDLLAELMRGSRGIAIAGTHGKTTTTGLVARVLEAGGLDPTVAIGGERIDSGTNARCGRGPWFVTEADESDGSFLALAPEIAVVTNVENDHIASDAEFPALVAQFVRFLAALPAHGLALVGLDDPNRVAPAVRELLAGPRSARLRTFGLHPEADLRATELVHAGFGSTFTVTDGGTALGSFALAVPGRINVLDALPAIAIGRELGVDVAAIREALVGFRGVRRRFEVLARTPRLTVVDDYAHHPTALRLTIAAARAAHDGPIVVAFQPHRYSRTAYLGTEFAHALEGADSVVLTEIYAASEAPLPGIDARTIGVPLAATGTPVAYVDVDALADHLTREAPRGALVLMLGAGSITAAAARLAAQVDVEAAGVRT